MNMKHRLMWPSSLFRVAVFTLTMVWSVPAFAQFDIVGNWIPAGGGPIFAGGTGFQEDDPERSMGPAR